MLSPAASSKQRPFMGESPTRRVQWPQPSHRLFPASMANKDVQRALLGGSVPLIQHPISYHGQPQKWVPRHTGSEASGSVE